MLPGGAVGLVTVLTADALEKHIAAHPGERAWIELAIEHGAIRKIAESEVTENSSWYTGYMMRIPSARGTTRNRRPEKMTGQVSTDTVVSTHENKNALIDADAEMIRRLDDEYVRLYDRKQEINREFLARLDKEIEPLVVRMRENRAERLNYEPKPRCFGIPENVGSLPDCEGCRFQLSCFEAALRCMRRGVGDV